MRLELSGRGDKFGTKCPRFPRRIDPPGTSMKISVTTEHRVRHTFSDIWLLISLTEDFFVVICDNP
jgi:hypothetical protein